LLKVNVDQKENATMKCKLKCFKKAVILFLLSFMMFVGCSKRYNLPAITNKTFKDFSIIGSSTKNVNRHVDLKNIDSPKKDQEKIAVSSRLPQKRSRQERVEDESIRLIEKTKSNCINCF
jgi:hypothetical protein